MKTKKQLAILAAHGTVTLAACGVRADPNLSHCADPILSQGW